MKKFFIILCCVLHLFISGCDTAEMFTTSTIEAPVVPGIFITDENANILGTWMNPYSPGYRFPSSNPNLAPITMKCSVYPNPNDGNLTIGFFIPYQGEGNVTVYPALSPLENNENSVYYFGSTFLYVSSDPLKTLLDGDLNTGSYSVNWNGCDEDGNYAPDGFYRAYLDFDDYLVWVDIFLVRDLNNLPPGMGWGGPEW